MASFKELENLYRDYLVNIKFKDQPCHIEILGKWRDDEAYNIKFKVGEWYSIAKQKIIA